MSKIPAINQKAAVRTVVCLFMLALLVLGYNWIRSWRDPDDFSSFDSTGMIVALKSVPGGNRVVILKPDGEIWEDKDYVEGKIDRDPAWRPDGGVVLFSSDREENVYNIYRWNLMRNMVQRRSHGSRGRLAVRFLPKSLGGSNDLCLITGGGTVQAFRADDGTTDQILPPIPRGASTTSESETGATVAGQFDASYRELGLSFREARWGPNRDWVMAVMRSDFGETLVFTDMSKGLPTPVCKADKVYFDVSPADGSVVYAQIGTQVTLPQNPSAEDADKAKKLMADRHQLVLMSRGKQTGRFGLMVSRSDKEAYGWPSFSPDGTKLVVIVGSYEGSGNLNPQRMVLFDLAARTPPVQLVEGNVTDPSWSPDGDRIVFIRNNGRERSICTCSPQGGDEKNLTAGKGNFSSPKFSPRTSK